MESTLDHILLEHHTVQNYPTHAFQTEVAAYYHAIAQVGEKGDFVKNHLTKHSVKPFLSHYFMVMSFVKSIFHTFVRNAYAAKLF
jgi:hypothetical protein